MERICAAKDYADTTLESITRSWDEKSLHTATAFDTTTALQLLNRKDCCQSLRDLPFHEMQSGAAALTRQSGNILDIAIGFVTQHRVHSLMEGLWRTANSCKAGLVVGALRTACSGLLPDSTLLRQTQDAFWGATMGSILFGITIDAPPYSNPYVRCGLALANASHLRPSSMIYCSNLPSEVTGSAFLLLACLTPSSQR